MSSVYNEPLSTTINWPADDTSQTRLDAPWLTIARVSWLMVVGIAAVLFVAGLVVGVGQLQEVCTGDLCHPMQLTPEEYQFHQQLDLSLTFYAWYTTISYAIFGFICVAVGTLIFWRKSDDWLALFISMVLALMGTGAIPVIIALEPHFSYIKVVTRLLPFVSLNLLPLIMFLFPDGRFVPGWTKWSAIAWIIYSVVIFVANPIGRGAITSGPPGPFTIFMFAMGGAVQIYRYRRTTNPHHRQQTRWVLFGFVGHVISVICIITAFALYPELTRTSQPNIIFDKYAFSIVGLTPILFIPMSLALSVMRYRLWDIDIIINRTLVYTILSAVVVGLYVLIVGLLSTLFHNGNSLLWSLAATGVVAVSFHTLMDTIRRTINRIMFGNRDEPYVVLEQLSRQFEPVMVVDEVLPAIVQTIAQTLRLPYAAITLNQQGKYELAAMYPASQANVPPRGSVQSIPLVYQSEIIGQLLVASRDRGDILSPRDVKLLETIARQASVAAYNVRLTADLQRSRQELVTAREEERRLLRRELHDGLGPVLASMSFRLDATHNLLESDVPQAQANLATLKDQVQDSLSTIRRIAYNLRPPALDELGLVGALREHCVAMGSSHSLKVSFDAPDTLPSLSAAVEVAAYRIAIEALTNIQRHAGASACCICMTVGDHLTIEVLDDGQGLGDNVRAGVGLTAMRERASELGGQCIIENRADGGTRVYAILPLIQET
jgi:signal transduction histidine kinase